MCDALETEGMVGVMFPPRTPAPVVRDHLNCLDSSWSVTAVGQARFWDVRDLPAGCGDGRARDRLSALIREGDKPGILYARTSQVTRS